MKVAIGVVLIGLLAVGVVVVRGDGVTGEPDAMKEEAMKSMTGQCHCGHVKYEIQGTIIRCSYCDCRGCQRATGTLKVPFVTVLRSDVTITAGKPAQFCSDSGEKCDAHGEWHFCPKCGTQIFWKGYKGDELDILAGTLDNTKLFQCTE